MATRLIELAGDGAPLRGWLTTRDAAPSPAVVMAHGFSATIDGMVAERYAAVFADAGFVVLLFDHQTFGRSGGEPRRQIDGWAQARGYRHAIDWIAMQPDVDGRRIALWGDSMSAAVALAVGSLDERVRAVVAQVPALGHTSVADDAGSLFARLRMGVLDAPPPIEATVTLPVVSPDQTGLPSHLPPLSAFHWFMSYGARHGTNWENSATRVTRAAAWTPSVCVPHVRVPSLYLVAPDDEMPGANAEVTLEAYRRTPGAELAEVRGGHFGLLYHREPEFARAARVQVEFLRRHLG